MGKLLSLDLSTAATGYAIFETESKALLIHGHFRPRKCGQTKGLKYPKLQLKKMQDMSQQVLDLIESLPDLDRIVIEEINRGVCRMSQKTLDGLHFILMDRIEHKLDLVLYRDSDGRDGWRTQLGLFLTEGDKITNAQRRKVNARLVKGQKKLSVINRKHLACRLINKLYLLNLDCDVRETDGDEADAIGLGHATLLGR